MPSEYSYGCPRRLNMPTTRYEVRQDTLSLNYCLCAGCRNRELVSVVDVEVVLGGIDYHIRAPIVEEYFHVYDRISFSSGATWYCHDSSEAFLQCEIC